MNNQEFIKSTPFIVVEIIEYEPHSIVSKTIIKKTTGNVSVMSFDDGEAMVEKTIPYDSFAQIIDGNAEIVLNSEVKLIETGSSIVIPAHTPHIIRANEKFKMIMTIIKNGYL